MLTILSQYIEMSTEGIQKHLMAFEPPLGRGFWHWVISLSENHLDIVRVSLIMPYRLYKKIRWTINSLKPFRYHEMPYHLYKKVCLTKYPLYSKEKQGKGTADHILTLVDYLLYVRTFLTKA